MRLIARSHVADAAVLIRADRYDTAVYPCGYAVEVALKARVCRTLGWPEFPGEPKEWQREHSPLKVHDLTLLAKWSGIELQLNSPPYLKQWLEVRGWNPEIRYHLPGRYTRAESMSILRSTRSLAGLLNPR